MPSPLERELSALLRDRGDAAAVAAMLKKRWLDGEMQEADQPTAAFFLIRAGQIRTLLEIASRLLNNARRIPWAGLAEAVAAARTHPREDEVRAISVGADEQGALADLLASQRPDEWSAVFQAKRAEYQNLRALELEDRRAQLWDAVRFMRANRLYDQEAKALEDLRCAFPDDPEFAQQNRSLQERWARDVIAKGARPSFDAREESERDERLTPEEEAVRTELARQALETALTKPDSSVDLALFLHFMGFNQEAVTALAAHANEPEARRDWLRLELLLLARQFVKALEEATRLEDRHRSEPDAVFACAYARARALWGLGERSRARDAMKAIVAVRPHYRAAQSLLLDWSEDADG